jgi:predicted dehydrogenase
MPVSENKARPCVAPAGPAPADGRGQPAHGIGGRKTADAETLTPARRLTPRLGFAGVGWIGAQRMNVLAESGLACIAAVCDPNRERRDAACAKLRQDPAHCERFEQLLEQPLDGVVIATPNTLHEPQAAAAMERGLAVFSQKPLALTASGTSKLLDLARLKDLPLGVDWSYRWLAGVPELKARIETGELGTITAAELCFHNAYGPDARWYYDLAQAGGGCLLDLGCHLLDLCHWLIGARGPREVRARCFRDGRRLHAPIMEPEDFVMAAIEYASGQHVHLSCSWRASAGRGAIIECRIFGTEGGAEIRNVDGSFYDFVVALHRRADTTVLAAPPDPWSGRALVDWTRRLRAGGGCGDLGHLQTTAVVIDTIYGRGTKGEATCAYS